MAGVERGGQCDHVGGLYLGPEDGSDAAWRNQTPVDHQLVRIGRAASSRQKRTRADVERLRDQMGCCGSGIVGSSDLQVALSQLVRGLWRGAPEDRRFVERDLRDEAGVGAVQPLLYRPPGDYVGGIVQVEKTTVIGPGAISKADLNVADVCATRVVIGVGGEVTGGEERQCTVARANQRRAGLGCRVVSAGIGRSE